MAHPKKIVILGGGIGGLTVAHFLSKFPEYDISIYEAKSTIGGLARSGRDQNGCATEYCWRVIFGFYDGLMGILNEIPTSSKTTAIDNLTVYKHVNVMDPLSTKDMIAGYSSIFAGLGACDERLDELDNQSWWEALHTASDSNLFREIGGWLGMDRYRGSYKSVIKIGIEQQIVPSYLSNTYKDYVTTKPTSEAIFEPWQNLLESRGVKVYTDSPVTNIEIRSDRVVYAKVGKEHVEADYFIFNLPVEVLEPLLRNANIDSTKFAISNLTRLKEECLHTQLSFQLYFNRPVSLGGNNAFLLVESPWDLIVLSYDAIYQTQLCKDLPGVKGGWSVAACTAYIPGIVYGKTMAECTEEEINTELWAQLSSSKRLQNLITANNPFGLTKDIVVGWAEMWPTYDKKGSKEYGKSPALRTSEPKFTNNAGSYALRPSFRMYLKNAFISTAYIKETIDIFSMEAAVIAGKRVANAIDFRSPSPTIRDRPEMFRVLRNIDGVLYSLGLPNVIVVVSIFVLIILVMAIVSTRPKNDKYK